MTSRSASCPNCGAPLTYRWSSSVQANCEYCRSIIVRTDVDLKSSVGDPRILLERLVVELCDRQVRKA